eukprot:CAMPEP_0114978488 /NCGR_PEP_ID=MMETSP0216-20121206/3833_1 /TAXON_ID=223996 /ORGANISM="Protocruzia adherens, Strain Boccale" /LENGTH=524 /DNA_ID=CAMNT_0002339687 /DNA_START=38 /DNA_END=1612 /DNA_ORIENTATION=+
MSGKYIIRIHGEFGRSRIEIPADATVADFKFQVEEHTNIPAASQEYFKDPEFKSSLHLQNQSKISSSGLNHGDMVFIKGAGGEKGKISAETMNHVLAPRENRERNIAEETEAAKKATASGIPQKEEDKEEKMEEQKEEQEEEETSPTSGKIKGTKHMSFEAYLKKNPALFTVKGPKGKDVNANTLALSEQRFKLKLDCKNHKPYPDGLCNKCLPETAILNRQKYRHVDYIEFMNLAEVQGFINNWSAEHHMTQRMGFMYGYYCEDPVYEDGVRGIVEAIYEPPQEGSTNGFVLLNDEHAHEVDAIAEALGFERIGWIFTTLNNDTFMSSHEIRRAAQYQQQYVTTHESGYRVSKFTTVVLRPKGDHGEVAPDAYMVSDQCQALERDDVFGESEFRKKMVLRKPTKKTEMIPTVLYQGKNVTEFEPDFFIVNVAAGSSKSQNNYNILKNFDFPIENRKSPQRTNDVKNYVKKHKSDPPSSRYASFHFIVYISKLLGVDTALTIANAVRDEQGLDSGFEELLMHID